MTKRMIDDLSYEVLGAAIEVHKELGPGLLESVYNLCLRHELKLRGLSFTCEKRVAVVYKGIKLDTELRCDLLIENLIAVELKSIESLLPLHNMQLLTYMKMLEIPKGILINFNSTNIFKSGQKTLVNNLYSILPD